MTRLLLLSFVSFFLPLLCHSQDEPRYGGNIAWMRGGGGGRVSELRLFPDGKRLAAVTNNIKIYNAETGDVLKTLIGQSHITTSLDLSRNGKVIAGTGDYEVTLWDAETGEEMRRIPISSDVGTVGLSSDAKYVAAGGYGGLVTVWEVETGAMVRTFQAGTDLIQYVRFSQWGDTLATSGREWDGVKLWDVSSGELLWEYVPPVAGFSPLIAFSPDGAHLAFVPNHQQVLLVDLHNDFDTATVVSLDLLRGIALAYSPDGKRLAMGISYGMFLWETETFAQENYIEIPHLATASITFSLGGDSLYSGGEGRGDIIITDIAQGKWVRFLNEYNAPARGLCLSPNGDITVASAIGSGFIHNSETGEVLGELSLRRLNVCDMMRISSDNKFLAGGCNDSLRVWTIGVWEQYPRTFKASSYFLVSIAWSADNRYVVGSDFRRLWKFDLLTNMITSPYVEDTVISSLKSSPDGSYLIGGGGDGVVRVWDIATGQLIHNLNTQHTFASPIGALDITKNGARFATGALDGRVILWDLPAATPVREFLHEGGVFTVGFTPDGYYLLSGGLDGRIIVWDVATGDSVYVYHERPYHIIELEVSPDGRLVLFGTEDGLVAYHARWKPSGVAGEEPKHEESVALMSVGPNPASEEIGVRFIVNPGKSEMVGVELYNAKGEVVRSVPEKRCESGLHERRLPVTGLPSGSYFVRLTGEGDREALPVRVVR